jgi:hypothetical protein
MRFNLEWNVDATGLTEPNKKVRRQLGTPHLDYFSERFASFRAFSQVFAISQFYGPAGTHHAFSRSRSSTVLPLLTSRGRARYYRVVSRAPASLAIRWINCTSPRG